MKKSRTNFDPREQGAYSIAETSRYLKLPSATLRSWVVGRPYPKGEGLAQFKPLIHPPSRTPPVLSFWNLIEAHVLRSLRTEHGVSIKALREAIAFSEKSLGIENLLLSDQLLTKAGRLFVDRYGQLIELSASGQIAMRRVFEEHLKRVEWDEKRFPVRLYPFLSGELPTIEKPIAIDARIAFGRPIVMRKGISTSAIASRIDAGEQIADVARDYELTEEEIEQAVVYERAA